LGRDVDMYREGVRRNKKGRDRETKRRFKIRVQEF
jgi:hypothetical protein